MSDEDGCLSRSMTIKAISTIMTERIWNNCAASEIVFQPMYPQISDPLHDESVIAVREEPNLHLLLPRDVTDDSQHVTLHVPLTAETKDPINEKVLMKLRKDATAVNVVCPEEVHETELLEDLSVQTEFWFISEVPHRTAEKVRA